MSNTGPTSDTRCKNTASNAGAPTETRAAEDATARMEKHFTAWTWLALLMSLLAGIAGGLVQFRCTQVPMQEHTTTYTNNIGAIIERKLYTQDAHCAKNDIIGKLCASAGISLAISALVILTLGQRSGRLSHKRVENCVAGSTKATLKEIESGLKTSAGDALNYAFGQMMAPECFQMLLQDVIRQDSLRRDVKWDYDFALDKDTNRLTLIRRVQYRCQCIRQNRPCKVKFKLTETRTLDSVVKPERLEVRDDGEAKFRTVYCDTAEAKPMTKTYREFVIEPGRSKEFILVSRQDFERPFAYATEFLPGGAIDLVLAVSIPKDYEFALHGSNLSATLNPEGQHPTKRRYVAKGAMFKGQGIEFSCLPKKEQGRNQLHLE